MIEVIDKGYTQYIHIIAGRIDISANAGGLMEPSRQETVKEIGKKNADKSRQNDSQNRDFLQVEQQEKHGGKRAQAQKREQDGQINSRQHGSSFFVKKGALQLIQSPKQEDVVQDYGEQEEGGKI